MSKTVKSLSELEVKVATPAAEAVEGEFVMEGENTKEVVMTEEKHTEEEGTPEGAVMKVLDGDALVAENEELRKQLAEATAKRTQLNGMVGQLEARLRKRTEAGDKQDARLKEIGIDLTALPEDAKTLDVLNQILTKKFPGLNKLVEFVEATDELTVKSELVNADPVMAAVIADVRKHICFVKDNDKYVIVETGTPVNAAPKVSELKYHQLG